MTKSHDVTVGGFIFLGAIIAASFVFLAIGISDEGAQIKYGLTRAACINQGWSAEQCANWNNEWENLAQ